MKNLNDPCESCGVHDGVQVIDGLYVCTKCAKKLKKRKRKEHKLDEVL